MRPYTSEELSQLAMIERIAWARSFRSAQEIPVESMPEFEKAHQAWEPMGDYEKREWMRCREFHRISDELAAEAGLKQPRAVFRENRLSWEDVAG